MLFGNRTILIEKDTSLMNALQIAYIGDAVWEIVVRNYLIGKRLNVHHMHSRCIQLVNARSQASFLELISDQLTPEEKDLVRRGRNAHARHPAPKNQNPENYSLATAFEALIGFLYLTGNDQRIDFLSEIILGGQDNG